MNLLFLLFYFLLFSKNSFLVIYFWPAILILLLNDVVFFKQSLLIDIGTYNINLKLINGLFFIHPQLLYISYALLIQVVFVLFVYICYYKKYINSIGVFLFKKNFDLTFKNIILNFGIVLIVAIVLGSWWAQQELDWGGWWNWDFVELISLILFFFFLINIHSLNRFLNIELSILAYFLFLFGFIFTTRYNIFPSIHNFLGVVHIDIWGFIIIQSTIITIVCVFTLFNSTKLRSNLTVLNSITFYFKFITTLYILYFCIFIISGFFFQSSISLLQTKLKLLLVLFTTLALSQVSTVCFCDLFFLVIFPFSFMIFLLFKFLFSQGQNNIVFHYFIVVFMCFFFINDYRDDFFIVFSNIIEEKINYTQYKFDCINIIQKHTGFQDVYSLKNILLNYQSFLIEPEFINDTFYNSLNSIFRYKKNNYLYLLLDLNIFFLSIVFILYKLVIANKENRKTKL